MERNMNDYEMLSKIRRLKELKAMAEELTTEIKNAESTIKEMMGDTEEMRIGEYKVTYKTIEASRLDSKSLQAELPDIAARYTVQTKYKRLTVL